MKETNPIMAIRSSGMSAAKDWSLPPAVWDEGMLYIGNCKA